MAAAYLKACISPETGYPTGIKRSQTTWNLEPNANVTKFHLLVLWLALGIRARVGVALGIRARIDLYNHHVNMLDIIYLSAGNYDIKIFVLGLSIVYWCTVINMTII